MALTVIKRPQGYSDASSPTLVTATVSSSSGALFTKTAHGLATGNFIYVTSNLEAYNGYWYVEKNDNNSFWVREYPTAAVQAFINSGDVTYNRVFAHSWSCVHLPIVYKLSSSLWPTNSADTIRTVSSISNDGGYVNLNLSGDIKATGSAAELEFVQVFGQNAGIYQIINWISDSDITIDFPYSAGVSFSASTVQYYYKDYHARIRIYAGINSSHTWGAQKPYELITTIKAVPDSNGIITINIADFVKAKIEIDKNNPILDTLPNDINSWCQFYIEHAEAYTYSNGYSLGTNVTSYTSDQGSFEGYAINAKLPFKTKSSGFMSAYVNDGTGNIVGQFLTAMSEPEISFSQYFDLSFITTVAPTGYYVELLYVKDDNSSVVDSINITDQDEGVYRIPIEFDSLYKYVRAAVYTSGGAQLSHSNLIIYMNRNCDSAASLADLFYVDLVWKNYLGGHDYWRFQAGKQLSFQTRKEESKVNIFPNWPRSYGAFADTISKNSNVESKRNYLIRSQHVTNEQAEDIISGIETALLVQIQNSRTDRRTVLVSGSNQLEETDKLKEVQLRIQYTDDSPTQSL